MANGAESEDKGMGEARISSGRAGSFKGYSVQGGKT